MSRIPYPLALAALFAGVLLCGAYWPGLHGSFFFDDIPNILTADNLRLESLSAESLRQVLSTGHSGLSVRPVAQLSFALNHYFSGLSPFAFKASNLAIHAANALLIFFLALRLLSQADQPAKPGRASIAAGVLAAAWLLHPIQLPAVLHVVQRMTSLSAFFLLAAILLHISARSDASRPHPERLLLAWFVMWPLSFFSKETGAIFPLFALAWELIVRRSTIGSLDCFARVFAGATALALIAAMVYALSARAQWLWAGYELRAFSLTERLMTEGRVLWLYLGLIAFPRIESLSLYHDDIAISTAILSPWTTLTSVVGLIGLIWLAWWAKKQAPVVSFGILWFLVGHGLESTALPLEIAHEHRNYLPLFGILLVGAWALNGSLQYTDRRKTIGIALAAVMIANFAFVTGLRAHQFGDEGRRRTIEVRHHPDSARAQHEAGVFYAEQPEAAQADSPTHALASKHYQRTCKLDQNSKMCLLSLIHLNCKARVPVEKEWIAELAHRLRETPFAPGDQTVLYSIKEMSISGSLCLNRLDVDGMFAAALANPRVSPGVQAILYSWHADYLWLHEHDMTAARSALQRSLTLNPASPSNRLKWAQLVFISGERAQAQQLLVALRDANFSTDEKKTLNELLATYNIAGH
jgi:hypothetical protein